MSQPLTHRMAVAKHNNKTQRTVEMKKLSLMAAMALGGLVAFSMLATAQEAGKESKKGGKGGFSVEQRLDRMSSQLSLTDEQKPKVKAVLEETAKKMKDVAPDERREKGRKIREEEMKKFKDILTPEQFTKYEQMSQRGGGEKKKSKKTTE
jgi:periplasmic protein CpxP/Spy